MGTLYECLKEVKLEKHYPALRANGITRSDLLVRLSPRDYDSIGITSTEEKRRLVELISIIKSVNTSENNSHDSPLAARRSVSQNKSARKRNRSPLYGAEASRISGRALTALNDVQVRESRPLNPPRNHIAPHDVLDLLSSTDEDESETDSSEHSDYEPATKHINAASSTPPPNRKMVVNRIKQKGYNYGVPKSSNVASTSRSRSKPISASRQATGDERIRVCVRKRPLNKKEIKSGEEDIARVESTAAICVNEPKLAVDLTAYTLEHEFIFDEVFDEKCSNEDVYIRATRPLISCIFNGGNATCFAYGQTGAGKTHTMIGSREIPGQYLLAAHDIFNLIQSGQHGSGLKLWVSFFEIYCGQLFDLLNRRNRLHAREDGSHRVCIAGLTETEAKDVHSLMQVLEYGNAVRSKGATGVNPDSSRSHAVLQIEVRDSNDKKLGRMSFIDLAGSERASDVTDTDKQTRMEGAEINQSLLALKECIRSIDQDSKHTPFRQSKLTHILKDSFIGDSRTCMIANISPSQSSCEHTLNTLRYADRVKELRRDPSFPSARGSAASHTLMNIPATGPSVFHPSNILCSSTPMKRKSSRQATSQVASSELFLDPNETPIKGHGVRRKTVNKPVNKPQPMRASASIQSRVAVVRHTTATPSTLEPETNSTSDSESDHTDSCNVTEPKNAQPQAQAQKITANIPVIGSTDTENDFPTTDFNNQEELNDLNRTGGKSKQEPDGGVKLSSAGHPLPVVGYSTQGALPQASYGASAAVSSSTPVLRQKVYTDQGQSGSPKANSAKTDSASESAVKEKSQVPINQVSSPLSAGPKLSESSPQHRSGVILPVGASVESFEDDLLFQVPSQPSVPIIRTPRTPLTPRTLSNGDMNLGLSRGRDAPFKVPQDPSVHPVLPAVLPAKSSDLTTFSQRSPGKIGIGRFHEPPVPPSPPFLLQNPPPISYPRVVHSPPQSQTNIYPESKPETTGASNYPFKYEDRAFQSNSEHTRDVQSNIGQGPYNYLGHGTSNNLKREKSDPGLANSDHSEGKHQTQGFIPSQESNIIRDSVSSDGDNAFSTDQWYNTPADFDTHINRSTNQLPKGHNMAASAAANLQNDKTVYPYSPRKLPTNNVDSEQTALKEIEKSEFLPFKRRNPNENDVKPRTDSSQRDVASRLRSVFFKTNSNDNADRNLFKQSDVKSVHSDSGIANTVYTDTSNYVPNLSKHEQSNNSNVSSGSGSSVGASSRAGSSNKNSAVQKTRTGSSDVKSAYFDHPSSPVDGRRSGSPFNGKSSSAIKTEKLGNGSAFSPIHPQPVTSMLAKSTIGAVSKDIMHPRPVVTAVSVDSHQARRDSSEKENMDSRQRVITAHEDQLAAVTSLCKQEMKLLLSAKAGHKTTDEYVQKVGNILRQKVNAIQLLQEQIELFCLSQGETSDDN